MIGPRLLNSVPTWKHRAIVAAAPYTLQAIVTRSDIPAGTALAEDSKAIGLVESGTIQDIIVIRGTGRQVAQPAEGLTRLKLPRVYTRKQAISNLSLGKLSSKCFVFVGVVMSGIAPALA
jgi:hypothetical protein